MARSFKAAEISMSPAGPWGHGVKNWDVLHFQYFSTMANMPAEIKVNACLLCLDGLI